MNNILEIKQLKKYFSTPRGMLHAVDDVSFSIERGKTLGVVGESGCGKSTLGRTILNLTPATSGEVLFEGKNIVGLTGHKARQYYQDMQLIFQDPFSSLNPRLSVFQTIAEPLQIHHICKSKDELTQRVLELMATTGLAERLYNAYPHELDGGRRQRVGIARALALNPKFIVCDEPVSALDVSIQAQILNLMQDLQKENQLTYMFITHDLSVVKHISDEIIVMYLGTVVERCETKELFSHNLHPYTKALLSAIPIPVVTGEKKKLVPLRGEITSPIEPKQECRFAARCDYACEKCTSGQPKLREVTPGHFVACFRAEEINNLANSSSL